MKKELSAIGIALSILFIASTITSNVTAQIMSTNVSNAAGNMSAPPNQTASEMGQNMSSAMGNATQAANQTMGELGENASDFGG
jgi:surface antigen